ncbi:MAG: DoxX family protein [Actinomycetes bacterium]
MLVRRLARVMLAASFVAEGLGTLRNPPVDEGQPLPAGLGSRVPYLPDDARTVVRATGAVQVAAGGMLATGHLPRLSALALATTLVPGTAASHRFWEAKDPQVRADQLAHFLKNVSLAGGLLIAGADTQGRPGLGWRARHAGRTSRHAVRASRREVRLASVAARQKAARRASSAARVARDRLPG